MSSLRIGAALLCTLLWGPVLHAAPVKVRLPEGASRAFLVLSALDGKALAYGELQQVPKGNVVESRLTFAFKDGSLHDETVNFSQKTVFQLERYHMLQRGPAFPTRVEQTFDRNSRQYHVRQRAPDDAEDVVASGELEMPPDLYNGMALTLLKNLPPGGDVTAQIVAFTPKPRLLKMQLGSEGQDTVWLGETRKRLVRHLVNLEIGGLAGVVASVVGKEPPDLRYWIAPGAVPAFVRFQGAMFLNGPVWRIEMANPRWAK